MFSFSIKIPPKREIQDRRYKTEDIPNPENILSPVSCIFFIGQGIKNPTPWTNRGGIQVSIPRFHPGYGKWPSLIDAITGAPGRAFLPCGSEVVSQAAVLRKPCTIVASSLGILPLRVSSSQLFSNRNLAYFFRKVNGFRGGNPMSKDKTSEWNRAGIGHNAHATKNSGRWQIASACVNNCNFLTPYIVRRSS